MIRHLLAIIGAAAIMVGVSNAAVESQIPKTRAVSVANNSGGSVVEFAMRTATYRKNRTRVQITGRCDSACTLYLALPTNQLCVSPGAYFRFHSPQAGSSGDVSVAKNFMLRKYPGWVRNWISSQGGLSHRLLKMDYSYASRFVPRCSSQAATK